MLTKQQAAEQLGVTTRTLERHVKDGKLSVRYQPSPNGEIALFDPEEIENLRQGRETIRIKPRVEIDPPTTPDSPRQPTQIATTSRINDRLIEPQQPETSLGFNTIIAPLAALFGNLTRAIDNHGSRVSATELRSKLLTLDEAQIVTGLSRDILQEAIRNGELPSKIMGKAYRIKTQDLEQYIRDLQF
jgi:excisionase family DNA binding protein